MTPVQLFIPLSFSISGALLFVLEPEISFSKVAKLPDSSQVHSRLARMGCEGKYEAFRVKQVATSLLCAGVGLLFGLAISAPLVLAFAQAIFFFAATFLLIDRQLTKDIENYRALIESEFPAVIEMLTLALSAGETPIGAMSRIANRSKGHLAKELTTVVSSVRFGAPFHVTLDALGRRIESVVIRRFVDALITAMLRGAPLIDVLARHASEARQIQRNHLMNKAGRAELSMMVPVVFLILPVSILFALWPSINHLNLFAA